MKKAVRNIHTAFVPKKGQISNQKLVQDILALLD